MRNGVYDQRRDWFFQNVRLMHALTEKGYDVNYTWGIGRHGSKQGGAIFPDMMRWLWRDHPVSTDVNDTIERSFQEPGLKAGRRADDAEAPAVRTGLAQNCQRPPTPMPSSRCWLAHWAGPL